MQKPFMKKYRDTADVSSAILAGSKRLQTRMAHTQKIDTNTNDGEMTYLQVANTSKLLIKMTLKKIAKPIVQFGYRLTKPILLPIAFKLRQYLIKDLHQELRCSTSLMQKTLNSLSLKLEETQRQIQLSAGNLSGKVDSVAIGANRIEGYSLTAARRFALNCGHDIVLIRTEVGFLLCDANDHALLAHLSEIGDLEAGTRLLIQKFLQPDDIYVDVGANVGMHVLAAAHAMQGKGKIIAFEPFERTKELLDKSVWMNGFAEFIEIHQAAVSNHKGREKFHLGKTSGHHSLFSDSETKGLSSDTVEVSLVTLDETVKPDFKVDLLKIDAEGAEIDVIMGGKVLIESNQDIALIVEFGPSHLKRTGYTPSQWLEVFSSFGLKYKIINSQTGALEEWPREQLVSIDSVNLFFARENSSAWSRLLQ